MAGYFNTTCQAADAVQTKINPTDGPESRRELVTWSPGERGIQTFRDDWPDKIHAGPLEFRIKEIESVKDGFTFKPESYFASCAYKAVKVSSKPNSLKPGKVDLKSRGLESKDFHTDQLPKMTVAGQELRLPAVISDVRNEGASFTAVFSFAEEDVTCNVDRTAYQTTVNPMPDFRSLHYGPHFRQTIDFFKAKSDKPAPVVVLIHGGGWGGGCKTGVGGATSVGPFLAQGISVARINYRFCGMDNLTPPVAAPLLDAARAVQFLRFKAAELNIDKHRFAAAGVSAGGYSALWLDFHKDLANPDSSDPVARESTRLLCAGGADTPTTLDPQQIQDWIPVNWGYGCFDRKAGWGSPFQKFLDRRDEFLAKGYIQEFSPWWLVARDSPPVCLTYGLPMPKPGEKDPNQIHSPLWGLHLLKRMREIGVECHLTSKGMRDSDPGYPGYYEFICMKLKEEPMIHSSNIGFTMGGAVLAAEPVVVQNKESTGMQEMLRPYLDLEYNPPQGLDKDRPSIKETARKITAALPAQLSAPAAAKRRILVLTYKTHGQLHVPGAAGLLRLLCEAAYKFPNAFELVECYTSAGVDAKMLGGFDAVVLNNIGQTLAANEDILYNKLLPEYVKNGGGLFAVHAAALLFPLHYGLKPGAADAEFDKMLGGFVLISPENASSVHPKSVGRWNHCSPFAIKVLEPGNPLAAAFRAVADKIHIQELPVERRQTSRVAGYVQSTLELADELYVFSSDSNQDHATRCIVSLDPDKVPKESFPGDNGFRYSLI